MVVLVYVDIYMSIYTSSINRITLLGVRASVVLKGAEDVSIVVNLSSRRTSLTVREELCSNSPSQDPGKSSHPAGPPFCPDSGVANWSIFGDFPLTSGRLRRIRGSRACNMRFSIQATVSDMVACTRQYTCNIAHSTVIYIRALLPAPEQWLENLADTVGNKCLPCFA